MHSSEDPRPHATVAVSTVSMRAKRQSIVHHVYFDTAKTSEGNPQGVYTGHNLPVKVVSDPQHVQNAYDTALVRRSIFDDIPAGKAGVGYSPDLNSYYILDDAGQKQLKIELLPHPTIPLTWYFTNPNTDQSTTALFPKGCGVPLPNQLPSTPKPPKAVPASIPTYWQTPPHPSGSSAPSGNTQSPAMYSASSSTAPLSGSWALPILPTDTPYATVTIKHNSYQFERQDGKLIQSVASDWKASRIPYEGVIHPCLVYTGKKSGKRWYTWKLPGTAE